MNSERSFPEQNHFDQPAFKVGIISFAYFCALYTSSLFPDTEKVLVAIWPAGGIGLAALLLNPRRLWPAILIGCFVAGNFANLLIDRPLFNSLGFMTANVLESLSCAIFITWACGQGVTFSRVREILALLVASTLVTAEAVLRDPSVLRGQTVEEDQTKVAAAEEFSAKNMTPVNEVARNRRPDGEIRWFQLSSSPRLLEDGRILWDGIQLVSMLTGQIDGTIEMSRGAGTMFSIAFNINQENEGKKPNE